MEKEDLIKHQKQQVYRILEKVYERKDKKSAYYIAEDTCLGRKVGIKQVQEEKSGKQKEEVKMLLKLSETTQYVPRIYDVVKQQNQIFMIMEHIEGKTLRKYLETEKEKIAQNHTSIFLKLCRILQQIELEHRDIKPENIILTKYQNGNCKDVFLIDFGLTSLYPFADEGTKGYQAPEQRKDTDYKIKAEKGNKVDMYACGMLLYEMIMGESAIEGKNYSLQEAIEEWTMFQELEAKGISQEEINFIKKCLAICPKDRFFDKKEMFYQYQNISNKEKLWKTNTRY